MPGKMTKSILRPPFRPPQVPAAVRSSRLSCGKVGKAQIFTSARESSGESPVFGGDITDRLDRLGDQIMPAKREQIEAEIAKRIPRPTPAEYKDIARRCAQSLGSEWIGDRMQAALQDEAEQVGNLAQSARDALEPPMHCNFCGKDPVEAMIKTWKGWYICSECVDRHTALLAKHRSQSPL